MFLEPPRRHCTGYSLPAGTEYCHQRMRIGQQQIAIAALAIGSFAAGYGVSFLRFDSREPDEAYVNYMRQCVFLGDKRRSVRRGIALDGHRRKIFYSEAGRRAQAKFERKRREEEERAKAECEAQGRKDASCEIEQFLKAKRKID